VLDLYAEPRDAKRPVVCFDESPIQLIGEVRRLPANFIAIRRLGSSAIASMSFSISAASPSYSPKTARSHGPRRDFARAAWHGDRVER
jgi:hypothetical protein